MNRKHFRLLAEIIKRNLSVSQDRECVEQIALDLAYMCSDENPRFDHNRFLSACGLGETVFANVPAEAAV